MGALIRVSRFSSTNLKENTISYYPPINDAELDAIAASDMCLEEKLSWHLTSLLGREVGLTWVGLAADLLWAEDSGQEQTRALAVPGFEAFSREASTRSEQLKVTGLYRYLGQNLFLVKGMFSGKASEIIGNSKASLDQKLVWHCFLFRPILKVNAVDTMRQAIYLDAYGFDLDSTMIKLVPGATYEGRDEMSIRQVIDSFQLTPYLLQTEDKAARDARALAAPAAEVSARQVVEDWM